MTTKIEKYLLELMILGLPFTALPAIFSKYISGKLSTDILLILILFILWDIVNGHKINRQAVCYLVIMAFWGDFCIVYNLIYFPFINDLNTYNIHIVNTLHQNLSFVSKDTLQLVYYGIHSELRFLAHYCFPCSLVYVIWHIYKNNDRQLLPLVEKSVFILACVMEFYSVFELMWLKWGSGIGESFLTLVNPFLYDVASKSGWWPPLLWWNQLRSICVEPSFFGIIGALIIPVLWKIQFKKQSVFTFFVSLFFDIMVFATNSRTAIIILLAQVIFLFIFGIYYKKQDFWRKIFKICCMVLIAFLMNIGLGYVSFLTPTDNTHKSSENVENVISEYVNSNIKSVASTNKRSNLTRLDILKSHLAMIEDSPLFGKGYDVYIPSLEYFCKADLSKDIELNGYINDIHRDGFLHAGYPVVNELSFTGVAMGLPGILLYLMPFIYVFYGMYKYRRQILDEENMFIVISLLGSIIALFSNEAFYSLYLCLGVLYTKIYNIRHPIDRFSKN